MSRVHALCGVSAAAVGLALVAPVRMASAQSTDQPLPPVIVEPPTPARAATNPEPASSAAGRAKRRTQTAPNNEARQPAAGPAQNSGAQATDPTAYSVPNASTATKTDTPIMQTPASVMVIPHQVLEDRQVITIDQALQNVSNVTVTGGGAAGDAAPFSGISVRGFAADAIFRDGTRIDNYGQSGNAFTQGLANIDRIEVLKGPAAILFGLVEPGGIVNFVTKQPQSTPSYTLEETIGSFGLSRTTLNATGPLTKDGSVLYRLDTSYLNQGSQVDDVYNKNFFIAPVVQWKIDAQDTVKAEFNYRSANFGQNFGFIPVNSSASAPIGSIINPNPRLNYGNTSPDIEKTYFAALTWMHQFDNDWSLKQRFVLQETSVRSTEFDDPFAIVPNAGTTLADGTTPLVTPSGFAVQRGIFSAQNTVQNLNETTDLTGHFSTYGVRHTLLVGADFATFKVNGSNAQACFLDTNCSFVDLLNPVNPGTPFSGPPTFFHDFAQFTETSGFYVQDQLKLPYDFYLLGGGRFQYIHQTSLGSDGIYAHAVTPRAAILWQPREWLSLYTSYTESYGPAAVGAVTPDNKNVPPSAGSQIEYGVKTSFFGGKLTATAAYFDLTKTNVPTPDPFDLNFVFVTGAIRNRGAEFDLQGELSPGWKMIFNYAHNDARVTAENVVSGFNFQYPLGARFGGVPLDIAHLWTTYDFQDASLRGWKIGGGINIIGPTPYEETGGAFQAISLPDAVTFDLMTSYHFNVWNQKWTLQLNAINIFNRKYLSEAELISSGPTANFNFISGVWGTAPSPAPSGFHFRSLQFILIVGPLTQIVTLQAGQIVVGPEKGVTRLVGLKRSTKEQFASLPPGRFAKCHVLLGSAA
jgi:iron complex outermembrane recepter protein